MELSPKIVITFFVALNLVNLVFAIKCWDCRSDVDPACADPFDNTTLALTDCNYVNLPHLRGIISTMCRKIRQKVEGEWRVTRGCGFLTDQNAAENECIMRIGPNDIDMEFCTCTGDHGCNST